MAHVGCCILVERPGFKPIFAFHLTPENEAVSGAELIPPGYKVGQLEADLPFLLWQESMYSQVEARLTAEAEAKTPDEVGLRRAYEEGWESITHPAQVWFDEIENRFAVVVALRYLAHPPIVDGLLDAFELLDSNYEFYLQSDEISQTEVKVLLDYAEDDGLSLRLEPVSDSEPTDAPNRLRPGQYVMDFTKPPPDWFIERAQTIYAYSRPDWLPKLELDADPDLAKDDLTEVTDAPDASAP